MPVYQVETLATVRKFYEIEAADEKQALETAHLNEPVDEIEVATETVSAKVINVKAREIARKRLRARFRAVK